MHTAQRLHSLNIYMMKERGGVLKHDTLCILYIIKLVSMNTTDTLTAVCKY